MAVNLGTLVQYIGQDVMKSQTTGRAKPGSLARAIAKAHKKFNGAENLFLGLGRIEFTKEELREAYVTDHVDDYVKHHRGTPQEGPVARGISARNWDIPEEEFGRRVVEKLLASHSPVSHPSFAPDTYGHSERPVTRPRLTR